MKPTNNPKEIQAWMFYDWANSVYNLIVTAAIFPAYYSATTQKAFGGDLISCFGFEIKNSVLYSYALSFSFVVIVLLSPILSGIADYSGLKKRFMQFFTYLGSLACMALYFFNGKNVEYGIICAVLGSIGYAGSLIFYNSFLPEIATEDKVDKVSAKGFAMGYIGSVVLLLLNLMLLLNPHTFGFEERTEATKFGFILVGLWWAGFAQITFFRLKDRGIKNKVTFKILNKGIQEINKVLKDIKQATATKKFLLSFFFYSMGMHTIMYLAPLFADIEIGMKTDELIFVVLILQIVAIVGAFILAEISKRKGNKYAILLCLFIWIFICTMTYMLTKKLHFYMLAAVLGFVMGGVQSISRSTYTKLIPQKTTDTASYFSFYDIMEKLAIVLGTLSYGIIEQQTGSMRNSMLFMGVFFIIGIVILKTAPIKK